MLLDKFWVVRNPGPDSEMSECCFETDMATFSNYIFGTGKDRFELENHVLHSSERTARADAEMRFRVRDDLVKILAANKAKLRETE